MAKTMSVKFIKNFLIFSLFIFLLIVPLQWIINQEDFLLILFGAAFMFFITFLSGIAISYTLMDEHTKFMMAMMGSTFFKILLSLAFIFIIIQQFPGNELIIATSFLVFYLLFTGFEIYQLLLNLRPHLKRKRKSENR